MIEQDEDETPTIFRKFSKREGGAVIAIFPLQLGTNDERTCGSYLHVGQHGACDPVYLTKITRKATPEEYRALKAELESIGYRIRVVDRLSNQYFFGRRDALRAIRSAA